MWFTEDMYDWLYIYSWFDHLMMITESYKIIVLFSLSVLFVCSVYILQSVFCLKYIYNDVIGAGWL